MKTIAEIDPNFRLAEDIPSDMSFLDVREGPFQIYGVAPNKEGVFCRLPLEFLSECSEGIQQLAYFLAGACVRFSTDAENLAVIWELTDTTNMPHFAASGQSGMEIFEETEGGTRYIANLIPAMDEGRGCLAGQSGYFQLPGGMRHYVLYLPLYNGLNTLMLGFPRQAKILPGRKPRVERPIVFYGSSITQGGCASKAGSCYTTLLARRLDAAQINLGFSGCAKAEQDLARYISSLQMSAFVYDYDHNALRIKYLEETHEPFFRIIREAQPNLPIIMVSRPDFDLKPANSAKRREIIRRTYSRALEAGDRNVYFVDGEKLFGEMDRDLCTVDGIHPTDIGFLRIADQLEPILRRILYP